MILLSGATSGLGSALVPELSSFDDLVGTYFSSTPEAVPNVTFHRVDVTDPASVSELATRIGSPDRLTLINLAGSSLDRLAVSMTPAEWDSVVGVNLKGAFLMSREMLKIMMRKRWGRIINVSSVVAKRGVAGTAAYAAAKAGVEGLTRSLALEYGRYNITVNCIVLGYYSVGLIRDVSEARRAEIINQTAALRLGEPRDILPAIRFLIDAEYVTGASIPIDGGLA